MALKKRRIKMLEKQEIKRNERSTQALRRQRKDGRVVVHIQDQSIMLYKVL